MPCLSRIRSAPRTASAAVTLAFALSGTTTAQDGGPSDATGLRAGERSYVVATTERGAEQRHGRVLDARTGKPIAGARVELWTEEITAWSGGFFRVGEATTRRDGRFAVRTRYGAGEASKARVYAPGYVIRSLAAGECSGIVRLHPTRDGEVPSLRVVDTAGRPIPGARVTSTQTCAHDLPAFEAETGPDGVVSLPGFGLSDDAPDLRVRAPGFLGVKYLDLTRVLYATPPGEESIVLRRCRPIAFRYVDASGAPVPNQPIWIRDGDGYVVERTDGDGVVRFTDRFDNDPYANLIGASEPDFIGDVSPRLPSGYLPSYRLLAEDLIEGEPSATVEFAIPAVPAEAEDEAIDPAVPVRMFHASGWACRIEARDGTSVRVPAGDVHLAVGAPFSGFELQELDVAIGEGESKTVPLDVTREPRITVRLGSEEDEEKRSVWIESSLGVTRTTVWAGQPTPVPAAPLVVGFGVQNPRLLREVAAVHDGLVLDLERPTEPVEKPGDPVEQRMRLLSAPDGAPIVAAVDGFDVVDDVSGLRVGRGPRGRLWRASVELPGHVPVEIRGRYGADEVLVEVPRAAALELPGHGERFEVVGDEALDFDALAPGPLDLVLEWPDGFRRGLSLELEPGVRRRIDVRR